jgi:hypothetical protein
MPTNRTPINRNRRSSRITEEILQAYRVARRLYDESAIDQWGQRSEQCNQACSRLHDLLSRSCCDIDIFDTIGCEQVGRSWNEEPEEFQAALEIRRELEQAAAL